MKIDARAKYARTHEWVRVEGDKAYVGVSDHAQKEMGDIVFVELPSVGDRVKCKQSFANLESVKAVSDVFSPVCGEVAEVNEELVDSPELLNIDCYANHIIVVNNFTLSADLLSAEEYEKL
jgi:glycine cleavage system H protein